MAGQSSEELVAFRGSVLHCLDDPGEGRRGAGIEYFEDGLLVLRNGRVLQIGETKELLRDLPDGIRVHDYAGRFIVPGFVDTHIHYAQTEVIASYGEQLLDWLQKYAFPAERRFADAQHAARVAEFFCDELLRNGTTTALVMGTVHRVSADALFTAAAARGMRLVAGKVLMDRNCPGYLRDTPETGYADSSDLIERWHGSGRLLYAVTPRFAPTSSDEQLHLSEKLLREHPGVYFHTHAAENRGEVAWVGKLFPGSRSYMDVYDRFGLLRERSVYAHCIHIDDADRARMAACGAGIAFCPTSNLFLGSGLMDLGGALDAGVRVGVGTDVGGGTSFSMLQTMNEAYKVAQLRGRHLSPQRAFYLATLGGARALYLEDRIGNFAPGKEADFIVIDPQATPILRLRMESMSDPGDRLFALIMLGDDRVIEATYLLGRKTGAGTDSQAADR